MPPCCLHVALHVALSNMHTIPQNTAASTATRRASQMVGGVASELQSYVNDPLVQQALASQPAVGAALNMAGTALGQLGNVGEASSPDCPPARPPPRLRAPLAACRLHACKTDRLATAVVATAIVCSGRPE